MQEIEAACQAAITQFLIDFSINLIGHSTLRNVGGWGVKKADVNEEELGELAFCSDG